MYSAYTYFSSWIRNPTDVVPVQRRALREHYLPVLVPVTHIEVKVRNNSDQGNTPPVTGGREWTRSNIHRCTLLTQLDFVIGVAGVC